MFKNTTGQKLTVFAFDVTTNLPKTGDAANLTAYYSLNDGTVTILTDTSATEQDATNAKGYYIFDLATAETNADKITFSAKSSTSNISVIAVPAVVYTIPASLGTATFPSGTIANTTNITAGTVTTATNLTNLPAAPTDWVSAASVSAAAVTKIQTGLATPTNITAGTITTVTNLTNAPTSGDLTSTMKASVTTAASAATPVASIGSGGITSSSFTAGAINNTAIAADAIGASELAADAVTEIQSGLATSSALSTLQTSVDNLPNDLLIAIDVETGFNVIETLRLILAASAGKVTGGGTTTINIRNVGDSKTRITATVVPTTGDRTALTYDVTP